MKKKNAYIILLILFAAGIAVIFLKYRHTESEKENRTFTLLPRKGAAANTAEWKDVQNKVEEYLKTLQSNPADVNASLRLAALYIQEARETGNHMYYDQAAMKYVNNVLTKEPSNFNALVYRALLLMSQHHFSDGLAAAKEAQKVNPYNAYVYGLLVDGYVEMGNYDSAVANADRMVSIRPDLTSYSRVSYLREIYGNYKSAIDAMKMAVEAGGRGDEHTEWTRTQLAALFEKTGDYKTAEELYKISLSLRPDYPYALAGLARVAVARNDYVKAIGLYQKADSLVNDNGIKEELADAYRLAGQNSKANELEEVIVKDLTDAASAGNNDDNVGHYADRELAYAYLKLNKPEKALEHAMLEYNRRPANIDVNETVAWVHYNKGEYDKALPYIKEALKTNSKNPILLSRAGLIYYKSGEKQLARSMLKEAAVNNAFIGSSLQAEAKNAMQNM